MEELRSAVIKHQKNFSELVVTDNAIKDGINSNSNNLEALKNLTLPTPKAKAMPVRLYIHTMNNK